MASKKTLSSDDSLLFRQTVGEVQQLKHDKITPCVAKRPKAVPNHPHILIEHALSKVSHGVETVGLEDNLCFAIDGIRASTLKKMRQGQLGIDASIDLHGLNSHDAKQQLLHFLHDSALNGFRCVHIVHGKGYRSHNHQPVLKNYINLWLRQHRDVQAFCSASAKQGGSGAVFVLLKLADKFGDSDKFDE